MSTNIVLQGRGGYIEVGDYRFDIEMQVGKPDFCIHFPRRTLDKSIIKARGEIESLIASEPSKWELAEYDSSHGFYGGMTVNERLYVSGLIEEFDSAMENKDMGLAKIILTEVEVPEDSIEEIVKNA